MTVRGIAFAAVAVLAASCAWGVDGEAERARRGGAELVSNWHLGPFFEYRRAEPGHATFWAVRPFYSQVDDPASQTTVRDALWPLVALRDHKDVSWWRALIATGDSRATTPEWSFNIWPLWFSGADRKDDGYWGFFPFYGHHPHFLLMDDWTFGLWPIWHTYTVHGVRSQAILWPFITWRESPRAGCGVWPLCGQSRQRESDHGYALWPLVTWASFDEDRDTSGKGTAWWCLPFYGEVRRARESQTMVLPPFFSYTKTPDATRWRLPWPLLEFHTSSTRDRISVWPLWEQVRGYSYASATNTVSATNAAPNTVGRARRARRVEERTWRVGWQLVENTKLETARTREHRFNLFPFVTWERRWTRDRAENEKLVDSYFRVWPFWSSETVRGRTRSRTLELMPFRHSEGIERNWAPFWSLWEKDERPDGRTRYSIFFNFIAWQTGEPQAKEKQP